MEGHPGVLESNAGAIFAEEERCQSSPSTYLKTCIDDECTYQEPLSRPFLLPVCEDAMTKIWKLARHLTHIPHRMAMKTLHTLTDRIDSGGNLWERHHGKASCRPVSVTRGEDQRVQLTFRHAEKDGLQVERSRTYEFSPLFHKAVFFTEISISYDRSGTPSAVGFGGNSPGERHHLYLADNAIVLDKQFLYLNRANCETK